MSNEELTSSETDETLVTVLKDNALTVLPIGTKVYIPYISIVDDIYEVRECSIESIGDMVQDGLITLFYNCTVSNTENSSKEKMTLNVLANVHTSFDKAKEELDSFLNKQIESLTEHSDAITKQLERNQKHIEMFLNKIK